MGLFVLLVLGVCWAFSANFERRLRDISRFSDIEDSEKLLSSDEQKRLITLVKQYRNTYGFVVRLTIGPTRVAKTGDNPQHLYASVDPATGHVDIRLPRLAQKILTEDDLDLHKERLAVCVKAAPPGTCLERFLLALHENLQQ